jgi:purine-binding chemotaxis protein CheW
MTRPGPSIEFSSELVLASEREQMESVWQRRADRLSRRTARARGSGGEVQVMVLGIGDERYGVELADVAEVLAAVRCTPVPGAPTALAGVIGVHGEIRPVIDLRRLLGIARSTDTNTPAPVVLLRKQGRQLGIQADRVEQIRTIAPGDKRRSGDGQIGPPARFLKFLADDTLMLLNTDALFAELSIEKGSAS